MVTDVDKGAPGPIRPLQRCVAVTPSDSQQPHYFRRLWIGGGGDVQLKARNSNTTVVFANVAAGTWLDVETSWIYPELTTATNIIGGS